MTRLLYDLAGADEALRFSPYCWRVKLALAHKNLSFETKAWHFTEKQEIAFSGQDKVPVLVDSGHVLADSQTIAEYLEDHYTNEASLFGEPPARALIMFIKSWADTVLHPAIGRIVIPDIYEALAEPDKAYFLATREARLGCSFAALVAMRAKYVNEFEAALKPLHATLQVQNFIAGEAPNYADHIVFGALQWARLVSSTPLLEKNGVLERWMAAVLAVYGLEA